MKHICNAKAAPDSPSIKKVIEMENIKACGKMRSSFRPAKLSGARKPFHAAPEEGRLLVDAALAGIASSRFSCASSRIDEAIAPALMERPALKIGKSSGKASQVLLKAGWFGDFPKNWKSTNAKEIRIVSAGARELRHCFLERFLEVKTSNMTQNVVLARWAKPESSPGPKNHYSGLKEAHSALAPSDVAGVVGEFERDFPGAVASGASPSIRVAYIMDKTWNEDMEDLR